MFVIILIYFTDLNSMETEVLASQLEAIMMNIKDVIHDEIHDDGASSSVLVLNVDSDKVEPKSWAALSVSRRMGFHDMRSPLKDKQLNMKSFVSSMSSRWWHMLDMEIPKRPSRVCSQISRKINCLS